ncbi:MAG: hypothetical protein H6713_23805 [Myxococcales bacterium]|nr:hypothetical protein [Myxococcales bacterium]
MSPTSIDSPPPLDRRARALLAAYREHEPPPGVRERGWARLEDAGHDDAIEPAPTPARATRVLTLALGVAAAYVLIVWIVAAVDRELVSPRAPDAAVQAQDGEGAGAETRAASAGTRASAVEGAPSSAATPPPPPSPVDVSDAPAPSAPGRSGSARSEKD